MLNFHGCKLKPLDLERSAFSPDPSSRMASNMSPSKCSIGVGNDTKTNFNESTKEQKVFSQYLEDEINRQLEIKTKAIFENINSAIGVIEQEKIKRSNADTSKYNSQKKYFKAEEGGYYQTNFSIDNKHFLKFQRSLTRLQSISKLKKCEIEPKKVESRNFNSRIHLREIYSSIDRNQEPSRKLPRVATQILQKRIRTHRF